MRNGLVQRDVVGYSQVWSWRASAAPARGLPNARQGSSAGGGLCGIHSNVEKEGVWGGERHLVQPEFPLSFQVNPMEEVGTEEEKHVSVSLHTNCLDRIIPQGNTAEGSRREGGFSCNSPLGVLYNHCQRGSQKRQKTWKVSTDPKGSPGSWNHYRETFSTNRNASFPPCNGSSSGHCQREKRPFNTQQPCSAPHPAGCVPS